MLYNKNSTCKIIIWLNKLVHVKLSRGKSYMSTLVKKKRQKSQNILYIHVCLKKVVVLLISQKETKVYTVGSITQTHKIFQIV